MKLIGILLVTSTLLGCTGPPPLAIVRRDGQPIDSNRVLVDRLQTDRLVCVAETQKARLSGGVYPGGGIVAQAIASSDRDNAAEQVLQGCMAEKGYAIVPKAQEASAEAYYRSLHEEASRAKVETGSVSR